VFRIKHTTVGALAWIKAQDRLRLSVTDDSHVASGHESADAIANVHTVHAPSNANDSPGTNQGVDRPL
jgi:hypothetical protein